ncbi:ATP synthase F0 sector subunit b [hydrothermal vent metagenome]|uniref:ATP synthase F0 sector subunit b n=1 Tax=hydrothermal vent metagenome TaxID=652676 RepID=A0A3B0UEM1_9ZZZZ
MGLLTPDLGLVVWTSIAFLMLVFLLSKFAWKPILQTLKIREESIDEALKAAELAREEMGELKADNEKLLVKAREERELLLRDATKAGSMIKEEAKTEAEAITKRMMEDAKAGIEAEKQAALAEVRSQVANLSVEIAEKIIRKNLENDKAQKALVDEFLKDKSFN